MKRLSLGKDTRTTVAIVFLSLYLALLLPLYAIGLFDVPSVDDFSISPAPAVSNPIDWFKTRIDSTLYGYNHWQGTFSSYFFSFLSPLNFSDMNYYICPLFLLSIFNISLFLMMYQALHVRLHLQIQHTLILFTIVATMAIQLMPSPVEAFYWWSGGFLYIGFFSVAMLAAALFLYLLSKKISWKHTFSYLLLGLLLFIVGGSNYPTAMAMFVFTGYMLLVSIFSKNKEQSLLCLWAVLFSAVSLLLNAIAPGNSTRLVTESVTYVPTIRKTLMIAFRLGFQFFRTWMTAPVFLGLLITAPFAYDALKNTKFKFRYPLLYTIASICMLCALFAPTAYSYGWIGPWRYMNIVYVVFILVVVSNVFYYIGWICAKTNEAFCDRMDEKERIQGQIFNALKRYLPAIPAFVLIFLFIVSQPGFYSDDEISAARTPYATESAINDLRNGSARAYHSQYVERTVHLHNSDETDLIFNPYTTKPHLLYFDDITSDPNDWRNALVAVYYGKASVTLAE
jgi:hypothetical protein